MMKERRREQKECYVKGIARHLHNHTPSLEMSLVESYSSPYLSFECWSDGSMDESNTESSLNTSDQSFCGASFDSEEGRPASGRKSRQENPNDVCPKCAPVLLRYADIFNSLVHQGTELKKEG